MISTPETLHPERETKIPVEEPLEAVHTLPVMDTDTDPDEDRSFEPTDEQRRIARDTVPSGATPLWTGRGATLRRPLRAPVARTAKPAVPKPIAPSRPAPPFSSPVVAPPPPVTKPAPTRARPITVQRPRYPSLARRRGWEGTCTLLVTIDGNGRVTNAKVEKSSGHRTLDDAARRCVEAWSFLPATRDGVAVGSSLRVPIRFRLK